jgi:dihydrolipoamide dehydrogenase
VFLDIIYDVVIIGGGPGGYSAAFRARELGLTAALVEVFKPGGVCLHAGCVPFKALEDSARAYVSARDANELGVIGGPPAADLSAMIDRKNGLVERMEADLRALFAEKKVAYFQGLGALTAPGSVMVRDLMAGTETALRGRNVILATGSKPRMIPGIAADGTAILYSDHIVDKRNLPEKMAILGGGAIGAETSTFYAALGCRVTILEAAPRLVMMEDTEVSDELARRFEERGIGVECGVAIAGVKAHGAGVSIEYGDAGGANRTLQADCLLVAAGREAFLDGLGLDAAGVKAERGYVMRDEVGRTNVDGIFAVGDVSGPPLLAHKAMAEGVIAVETIAGRNPQPLNLDQLPHCTFSDPEIGSVGLMESQVRDAGVACVIGRASFESNAKAMCEGRTGGFVKIVAARDTGLILGAHIVGGNATELIAVCVAAVVSNLTITQASRMVMAHPTRGEALTAALADARSQTRSV